MSQQQTPTPRTPSDALSEGQLRQRIEQAREQAAESLALLTGEIQPGVQFGYIAEKIIYWGDLAKYEVAELVARAKEGDRDALKLLAIGAGSVLGGLGLIVAVRARR